MKIKLLLLLLTTFGISQINAQCSETVSQFGNNTNIPMYNVNGDVSVTLNTNNTVTLDLGNNFMTAAGPDIRAFLVNSNGLSDAALANTLIANLEHVEFGIVGAIGSVNQNGAKSFTVSLPNGSSISEYDTVFFYCLQFNQFWDFGKFTPFTGTNCAFLSVDDNNLDVAVTMYPNPTNDQFELANNSQKEISVNIYNLLGDKVVTAEASRLNKRIFSLTNLSSGTYLVEIKSDTQKTVKKLIKR